MSQVIEFEGQEYDFPDDATNDEILDILSTVKTPEVSAMSDQLPQPEFAQSSEDEEAALAQPPAQEGQVDGEPKQVVGGEGKAPAEGLQAAKTTLVNLNTKQQEFRDNIAGVETGGLKKRSIRTTVTPKKGQPGSSAYGTFQITKGLIIQFLKSKGNLFSPDELGAMRELADRQKASLIIGGEDRESYEVGGTNRAHGQFLADSFGFETVDEFLDAFDYGGDFGLADDAQFQMQYENFARKMLNDTLKGAGGNVIEAASIWHGGAGWRTASSRKDTDKYREKFNKQ